MPYEICTSKLKYDFLILSCPSADISTILKNIPEEIKGLCEHVHHTKQMTIGFMSSEKIPKFSFILFFNHKITFIANNEEKYNQNSLYVPMSELFTEKSKDLSS